MIDWEKIRQDRYSMESPPPEWPSGVKPISLSGLTLLGVDPRTNRLYWDGHAIVTEKRLSDYERRLALAVTLATVVMALIEVGRAAHWITP